MAEVIDEVIDDVTDVTEENDTNDVGDDTAKLFAKYGVDPDNADTNDLLRVIQRADKAEKLIVEKKRAEKSQKSETPSDIMTKADYAMDKFLDKNPEMSEFTKELKSYTDKGLSLDEAKVLVKASDKTTANREKLTKARVSDGDASANSMKSEYTRAEVDRMAESDPTQYAKVADLLQSGKARLR